MIPKTKTGDCSDITCQAKNTDVIKVGKNLFCISCRRKQKVAAQLDRQKIKKPKANKNDFDLSYLINELDIIISKYVRSIDANRFKIVACYTCGWKGHMKHADCGHYIPRSVYHLRWDLRNLRVQCKNCNQFLNGNIDEYKKHLELETPGITDILKQESREVSKISKQDLKEMIITYRSKLKMIETKFDNQ